MQRSAQQQSNNPQPTTIKQHTTRQHKQFNQRVHINPSFRFFDRQSPLMYHNNFSSHNKMQPQVLNVETPCWTHNNRKRKNNSDNFDYGSNHFHSLPPKLQSTTNKKAAIAPTLQECTFVWSVKPTTNKSDRRQRTSCASSSAGSNNKNQRIPLPPVHDSAPSLRYWCLQRNKGDNDDPNILLVWKLHQVQHFLHQQQGQAQSFDTPQQQATHRHPCQQHNILSFSDPLQLDLLMARFVSFGHERQLTATS